MNIFFGLMEYFSLISFYIIMFLIKFMFLSRIYNYPHFILFFSLLFQIILIIIPLNSKSYHLNNENCPKIFFENNY